jgi:hypothetical protein
MKADFGEGKCLSSYLKLLLKDYERASFFIALELGDFLNQSCWV